MWCDPWALIRWLVMPLSGGWRQMTFHTPSLRPRILWTECQGTFVLVLTCPYTTVPRKPLCCVDRVEVWLIGIIFHTLWKWSPALKASRVLERKVNTRSKLYVHRTCSSSSCKCFNFEKFRSSKHNSIYVVVSMILMFCCNMLFIPVGHINLV